MGSQLQYPTHSTCALLSSSRIFYQKITQSEMKAIISIQNRANILIRNQENILFRNHRNVARHPESTWSRELDPLEKIGQQRYRWSRSWRCPGGEDDDDEVPDLVENFDEASKDEKATEDGKISEETPA